MADKRGRRRHKQKHDILHQILSFVPITYAIRTSVLSKRWRHVWCKNPSLYIEGLKPTDQGINETLTYFTAPKIMSFHLSIRRRYHPTTQLDRWIEFAISQNVQKLSLNLLLSHTYRFPELFYLCSSIKQLSLEMEYYVHNLIPTCTVSWQSLRNLSLRRCRLKDESIEKILSGCPNLVSLALYYCHLPQRIDLSKSLSLTRLDINRSDCYHDGPTEIVAPHIHYLRLKISEKLLTLEDVSSLIEANLDIRIYTYSSKDDFLQSMVLNMLEKFQNVEKLFVGVTFFRYILSHAALSGVHFRVLKVKTLIIKMEFVRSVIPGLARLLQNSPELVNLIVHPVDKNNLDFGLHFCSVPSSRDMYSILHCKDSTWKILASFMELVLRNAKTLETMVVWSGGFHFKKNGLFQHFRTTPMSQLCSNEAIAEYLHQ
ncbi:hypothetical protein EUTSA_v10027265mg [Eutrema salsugineum]|uniref:Uncharacterized protein n=1 Tax=Eutrema salsugineum TaxID=72664 RepID=V4ML06_EUTSA|nr:hypothetical protein EUTSA_v10027265mg [Eutrema salsugineum]